MSHDETIKRMVEAYRPMRDEIDRSMRLYQEHFDGIKRSMVDAFALNSAVKDLFPTRNILDTLAFSQLAQLEDFGLVRGNAEKFLDEMVKDWQSHASDYIASMTRGLDASMGDIVLSISKSLTEVAGIQRNIVGDHGRFIARELARNYDLASEYSRWVKGLHEQLAAVDVGKLLVDTNGIIEQFSGLYSDLPLEDLEDDTPLVEQRQAANLIAEKMEEIIGSKDVFCLPDLIDMILKALKSGAIKLAPRGQKLFYDLLVGILASLVASAIGFNLQEIIHKRPDKREVISAIKSVQKSSSFIPANVQVVFVNEYLVMRAGPSKNSLEIGRLYPGDVVTVVKVRSRSWALVEFQDRHSETLLRGWVFNRYLRSLRGRH